MQCRNCSQLLDENAKFCYNCGNPCENMQPVASQTNNPSDIQSGKSNKTLFIIIGSVIAILVVVVLFFVGNGISSNNDNKVTVCSSQSEKDGIRIDGTYKVTSKNGIVVLVESEEHIEGDSEYKINKLKESLEATYSPYKNLNHYHYELRTSKNTLISNVSINYAELDTDKMIQINPLMSLYIKNGKLYLEDLLRLYQVSGISCEK